MARHLCTILGDMLVTQALDSQNPEELPTPEVMPPDTQPGPEVGPACGPPSIRICSCHLPGSGPLTSLCLHLHLLSVTKVLSLTCPPFLTRLTPPSQLKFKPPKTWPCPPHSALLLRVPANSVIATPLVDTVFAKPNWLEF